MSRRRCRKRRVLKVVIQRLTEKIQDPETSQDGIENAQYELSKIKQKFGK